MRFTSGLRNKWLTAFLALVGLIQGAAQELNCTVTVNSDQVSQTNQQIFRTLERSLTDFVNQTQWTNRVYKENERLNCRMFITVTRFDNGRFEATIQLQSSR